VLAGDVAIALTQLDELARGGKDLGRLLGDLLNHFRNLLIYQVSQGDLNLMEVSEAEVAALKEQASLAGADAFTRILEVLADAELRLRDAASKKILLEVSLLRAIEARNAMSIDAVLKQLNQLRGQGSAGVAQAPAGRPTANPLTANVSARPAPVPALAPGKPASVARTEPPPTSAPSQVAVPTPAPAAPVLPVAQVAQVVAAAPVAPVPGAGNLVDLWSSLVEAVGRTSPFTRGYLIDAHPVSFERNVLVIGYDPEFEDHLGLVDNSRNHTLLATKLAELGHPNAKIKFSKAAAPADWVRKPLTASPTPPAAKPVGAPTAEPAPALAPGNTDEASPAAPAEKKTVSVPFNKDDFKNDPLIQQALEVFKGTIVEVRA